MVEDLAHFALGERIVVEAVDAAVVFKEDVRPILDQILFGGIVDDIFVPAVLLQKLDQGFLKF